MKQQVYIGLGSNLGNPAQHVTTAFNELASLPETQLVAASSLYRTSPFGDVPQPDYINAVACIDTELAPMVLLKALWQIEQQHGRIRDGIRWGPRTLDLDILLYGDLVMNTPQLIIPHPGLMERAFVLVPLREIAPTLELIFVPQPN